MKNKNLLKLYLSSKYTIQLCIILIAIFDKNKFSVFVVFLVTSSLLYQGITVLIIVYHLIYHEQIYEIYFFLFSTI